MVRCIFALTILAFCGCQPIGEPDPSRNVNLGKVFGEASHVFRVVNRSGRPFKILQMTPNCSCHQVEDHAGKVVENSETIEFNIALSESLTGHFSGKVVVVTDSDEPHYRQMEFELHAFREPDISVTPRFVELSFERRSAIVEVQSSVLDLSRSLESYATSDDSIEVRLDEEGASKLRFRISAGPSCPLQDFLVLRFEGEHPKTLSIPIFTDGKVDEIL